MTVKIILEYYSCNWKVNARKEKENATEKQQRRTLKQEGTKVRRQ